MDKEYIVLRGLEGNPPPELTLVQAIMAPHVDLLIYSWWCIWVTTLAWLAIRYVVTPLWRHLRRGK